MINKGDVIHPNSGSPRVLVLHPLLQHAHQLAMGLYGRGMLQAIWCGTPLIGPREKLPAWIPKRFAAKIKQVSIPGSMRRHPVWPHLLLRATRLLPSDSDLNDEHRVLHAFDLWVSRRLARTRPDIVVAYENSAYHTFIEARRLRIRCVLDAPSLHHVLADTMIDTPQTAFRKEINRRKDVEVELAERILTCSAMAADTYAAQGVPRIKLSPILLGAEVSYASPALASLKLEDPPLFVFAGGLGRRKSTDLILDAFELLAREGYRFRLLFVGGCADATLVNRIRCLPCAEYRPSEPQAELFKIFATAACLLLPSRFDAFGMVVAEAMACGTPAIVSFSTGAKEIIEQHPGSGWIVAATADAVHSVVSSLLRSPAQLSAARQYALEAAEQFTWQAYRDRVGDLFESMIQECR